MSETYRHLGDIDRVLTRPWVYCGADKVLDTKEIYVYDSNCIEKKSAKASHILFKMFDEGILNCFDQSIKKKDITEIDVSFNNDGAITIRDNGGMSTKYNKEFDMYMPQFVLTKLYTSSNYNDDEQNADDEAAQIGGQNGIGAKLISILSKKLEIDIVDRPRKERYQQVIRNNTRDIEEPEITKGTYDNNYFEIKFLPDYETLGLKKLDSFHKAFITKRCYDISMYTGSKVSVSINGEKIRIKKLEDYSRLYVLPGIKETTEFEIINIDKVSLEAAVAVVDNGPGSSFQCVSLVNGIVTYEGGTHVDAFTEALCDELVEVLSKKASLKEFKITGAVVKKFLTVFVKANVPTPRFASQSKEKLITPKKTDMKPLIVFKKATIKRLIEEHGLESIILDQFAEKTTKESKKTDGKKTANIYVPKLLDAEKSGTKESEKCTCIITEGDSAAGLAKNSLSAVGGNKYFGVFPIRGKLLNVRKATAAQIQANEEIISLKKIFGLKEGHTYKSLSELRYGSMMIMADQDVDGFHIRGLLINFVQSNWPELIQLGFVSGFTTPLVKLISKTPVAKKKALKISPELDGELWFFSEANYDTFIEENGESFVNGFKKKYFKGLGTSLTKDGVKYFSQISERQATYVNKTMEDTEELIDKCFNDKRADDRKLWLNTVHDQSGLDYSQTKVKMCDFINKELKAFSNEDNIRSIPKLLDGLKPSQREILYVATKVLKSKSKKELKESGAKEVKVSNFASEVSQTVDYAHGEVSLYGAIINMAQDYVSTGNHRVINPDGQFGSRWQHGKDSAAPRYIFTSYNQLDAFVHIDLDNPIMQYYRHEDSNRIREPIVMMPIVPTVLAYGISGIGTGYSTNIPCYNMIDLIESVRTCMRNEEPKDLIPWYHGFKGTITPDPKRNGSFIVEGIYKLKEKNGMYYVEVKEIPLDTSINDYTDYLIECMADEKLAKIKEKEVEDAKKRKEIKKTGKGKGKKVTAEASTPKKSSKAEKQKFVLTFSTGLTDDHNIDILIQISKETFELFDDSHEDAISALKLTGKINTSNMCMFVPASEEGLTVEEIAKRPYVIKKFSSVPEIVKSFYVQRYPGYVARKDYYKKHYKYEIDLRSEKMRFINEVMDGTLTVYRRKRAEIEVDLEAKKYKKFKYNESVTENYTYLFEIRTGQYTSEEIDKLQSEIDEFVELHRYYKQNTPAEIWEDDLAALEKRLM
jgi:DNA topoisomerase II